MSLNNTELTVLLLIYDGNHVCFLVAVVVVEVLKAGVVFRELSEAVCTTLWPKVSLDPK